MAVSQEDTSEKQHDDVDKEDDNELMMDSLMKQVGIASLTSKHSLNRKREEREMEMFTFFGDRKEGAFYEKAHKSQMAFETECLNKLPDFIEKVIVAIKQMATEFKNNKSIVNETTHSDNIKSIYQHLDSCVNALYQFAKGDFILIHTARKEKDLQSLILQFKTLSSAIHALASSLKVSLPESLDDLIEEIIEVINKSTQNAFEIKSTDDQRKEKGRNEKKSMSKILKITQLPKGTKDQKAVFISREIAWMMNLIAYCIEFDELDPSTPNYDKNREAAYEGAINSFARYTDRFKAFIYVPKVNKVRGNQKLVQKKRQATMLKKKEKMVKVIGEVINDYLLSSTIPEKRLNNVNMYMGSVNRKLDEFLGGDGIDVNHVKYVALTEEGKTYLTDEETTFEL